MATSTRRTAATTSASRKTTPARKTSARTARKKASAPLPPAATKPAAPPVAANASAPRKSSRKDAPAKSAGKAASADPKKVKLVRDSFTLPKVEYAVIDILKTRAGRLARPAKKNEIVRAGLKALISMSDAEFLACLTSLPPSRPKAKAAAAKG